MRSIQSVFVVMIVLLAGLFGIGESAAGDWTHPIVANETRTGTLPRAIGESQRLGQTTEYVAAEGATSYKIVSQPVDGLFALQKNGSLNITSRLDYENQTSYAIVVEASDGCSLKSTATVIVRVEDKNDNPPVFAGAPYFVIVPDNSTEGTFITKVTATDSDRSFYMGKIKSYDIRPGKDNDSFFIVASSGEIYIGKDRQLSSSVKTNYTFTVVASDTGTPIRTGTADVTVCVANCPRMGNGGQSVVVYGWTALLIMEVCLYFMS